MHWNERYRSYLSIISEAEISKQRTNTFNVEAVTKLLSDLEQLKSEKDLSFGERKILDTCKELLKNEIKPFKKYGHLYLVK